MLIKQSKVTSPVVIKGIKDNNLSTNRLTIEKSDRSISLYPFRLKDTGGSKNFEFFGFYFLFRKTRN